MFHGKAWGTGGFKGAEPTEGIAAGSSATTAQWGHGRQRSPLRRAQYTPGSRGLHKEPKAAGTPRLTRQPGSGEGCR
eukprot:545579-Alexandrium_andersonii.AAC.1